MSNRFHPWVPNLPLFSTKSLDINPLLNLCFFQAHGSSQRRREYLNNFQLWFSESITCFWKKRRWTCKNDIGNGIVYLFIDAPCIFNVLSPGLALSKIHVIFWWEGAHYVRFTWLLSTCCCFLRFRFTHSSMNMWIFFFGFSERTLSLSPLWYSTSISVMLQKNWIFPLRTSCTLSTSLYMKLSCVYSRLCFLTYKMDLSYLHIKWKLFSPYLWFLGWHGLTLSLYKLCDQSLAFAPRDDDHQPAKFSWNSLLWFFISPEQITAEKKLSFIKF